MLQKKALRVFNPICWISAPPTKAIFPSNSPNPLYGVRSHAQKKWFSVLTSKVTGDFRLCDPGQDFGNPLGLREKPPTVAILGVGDIISVVAIAACSVCFTGGEEEGPKQQLTKGMILGLQVAELDETNKICHERQTLCQGCMNLAQNVCHQV